VVMVAVRRLVRLHNQHVRLLRHRLLLVLTWMMISPSD
jgi:hypothetical protein